MNERGLVGPMLASLIVCMAQRMRLSRRHSQEFLHDWLGISLSTSTINRCIHEAGRAVEPLEEELVKEIEVTALACADETPWKEWGELLWLWVILTPTVTLFLIGDRSRELVTNLFGEQFGGWLMSGLSQIQKPPALLGTRQAQGAGPARGFQRRGSHLWRRGKPVA